ncbi:MAG TPA: pitrilysin family protein [Cyclobacteriaceae bacterium]|nr:pitrilysin family protein [Cyclobacteriaceae bacterium]HRJ81228.1 pitrilysin family protein [Cyclobacteriaceae bacterium]
MLNRKIPPAFNQETTFNLARPENQKLAGDNQLLFINGGEQDVVKIELIFHAGRWFESTPGTSHFTAILLPKGTTSRTSYQITSIFDFYGIHLEINPGMDFTSVSLYGLSRYIPVVLDLLVDIVTSSTFPENELQQAKNIYTQGLKINLEKTSYLAARSFRKTLFGDAHPYGKDFELSDVNNIDEACLIDFRNIFYKNFTAFVSGKVPEKLKQDIAVKLNQIKPLDIPAKHYIKSPSAQHNNHYDKPGSVQTSLRLGKQIVNRNHTDYPGLLLLNHILGGFFGSRLMKNIREDKGLTYGIHSSIHALKHESYFVIGADVNQENRLITIDEIKNEFEKLQKEAISKSELDVARNHFIGSLQSDMSTPFAHADKIKTISLFTLKTDYYQQLINTMMEISTENLQSLAQKYLTESDLYTTSVG